MAQASWPVLRALTIFNARRAQPAQAFRATQADKDAVTWAGFRPAVVKYRQRGLGRSETCHVGVHALQMAVSPPSTGQEACATKTACYRWIVTGVHLWLILWKAYDTLEEHALRHIASLGLGFSDFAILELLLHKGPMAVNAIGERVNLTSGSITVAVDRLERKRLVERRNDPGDRRARVVHLTDCGEKLIRCAFADHEAAMERAVAGLSAEERKQAGRLLKKLGLSAKAMLAER